ncbi:TadA family conjugal transfer-associated ATPase [Georgenia ruanii]|uniref:TadA family conjugal transfer-associated ATPase n=1 Tax=Georgenia ruanii TaxID=348442 RepID=A0A7J9UYY3_9MICO|nr:TadA family conjugal transfer-associated ATPase [Georgenia ruanii]MPV89838.1 TadA family conjugal transfer-associated ATPase [Georgenia ruanii]
MSGAVELAQVRTALARGASLPAALEEGGGVGARALLRLDTAVRVELRGAGPVLQPLLEDPAVTDVLVNGTDGVWVDRGAGLQRVPTDAAFADPGTVRALATRLAAACGQRLDDASPVVDGSLPDGTRLHAVLPPLSAGGTLISLRTHRARSFTLAELVRCGTVPADVAPVLRALVAARANVLVSGATGCGKTTLLATVLSLVAPDERIVCIEEAAELRPDHPHVVHLQTRRANVQQVGEVPLSELVRAAMRMRPDRLVLGECRGPEVRDVLGALNTGHDGGWATVHANTSADVPARLVALGALAGLGAQTVAAQAVSALDAVVHLRRDGGVRRVAEVGVLARSGGELVCAPALVIEGGAARAGPGWSRLARRLGGALPDGEAEGDGAPVPPPRRGRHAAGPS